MSANLKMRPTRLEARVYRAPVATPVRTSFGTMHDRPAVIVRVEDAEGAVGWGETWCNFPTVGAAYRARLIERIVAPLVLDRDWASPAAAYQHLTGALRILAIQAGEPGPIAAAIAGVDIALWDLAARRAGEPLWRLLGGAGDTVAAYASGLPPEGPVPLARAARDAGHRAFKLKIGFGRDRDLANLAALREALGDVPLFVDANQRWDLDEARAMADALAPFAPGWLEEPMPADSPDAAWQALAAVTPIPLAGGENLLADDELAHALALGALRVVQPDAAKRGGITGGLAIARRIRAAGARFCPHYLGGGIGLVASAHLLAAAGGDGLLEVDVQDNPLRDGLADALSPVRDGMLTLGDRPGLGVEPRLTAETYRVTGDN